MQLFQLMKHGSYESTKKKLPWQCVGGLSLSTLHFTAAPSDENLGPPTRASGQTIPEWAGPTGAATN